MRKLLIVLLVTPVFAFTQSFTDFKWNAEATFKSDQLEFKENDKPVFKGYKDSKITITQTGSPSTGTIVMKLSGYFEMYGTISSFKYEQDDKNKLISYNVSDGNKLCAVVLKYSTNGDELLGIIIVGTEDFTKKPNKKLTFMLTGFE